ncbi:MAG: CAP domain-containing protein [Candidatus Babeliaceae bacterium]|nr:CAP domain-containing protein [Candidatus Babeliaceae bacterium]
MRFVLFLSLIPNFVFCAQTSEISYLTSAFKQIAATISAKQDVKKKGDRTTIIAKKIHELINKNRMEHGLVTFAWDDTLAKAARNHSEDMVRRNYFDHKSPEGHDFMWRYQQVGFDGSVRVGNYIYYGAENIHMGWTFSKIYYTNDIETGRDRLSLDAIAQIAVNDWMNSSGHRKNILTPHWRREGIGVVISDNGNVLVTQNFC